MQRHRRTSLPILISLFAMLPACAADDAASEDNGESTAGDASDDEQGDANGSNADASSQGSQSDSDSGAESSEGTISGGSADEATASSGADTSSSGSETGDDYDVWELRIDNYAIGAQETDYACFSFSTTFDQLTHLVGFRPQIDNAAYVHHYVLTMSTDPNEEGCNELNGGMIYGWAPGVEEYWLPDEAGFLAGDQAGGKVTLNLQVHYNNPLEVSGELDSSGLDIYYTHDLRPNDAGVLVVASIQGFEIPPGEPEYPIVGSCTSESSNAMLNGPIQVFASSMHAHLIGKRLWTEVFRDGASLGELNRDDPFSFDTQNMKAVDFELRPGDELVNHCIYDSSERTDVTRGGPGSSDEMCWDSILYYPRSNVNGGYCPLTF